MKSNPLMVGVILSWVFCGVQVSIPAQARDSTSSLQLASCVDHLGETEVCPIRIRLRRGAHSTTITGSLSRKPDVRYYVLNAKAGQKMTLSFSSKAGPIRAGIKFPNGSGDGPFSGSNNVIKLPETGDYIIYVGQNRMAGQPWAGAFQMQVEVR